ncbi:protein of unknown function [Acetoanaerobium sticklandii]|uniref:Uncharacterized protein n=2 Tax=Acetoanaerobium sticklandii TaxID=1511 RepID=E3PY81_ACESD|nr:protein of unknown function [Acetoanaerobium sticklandii]
MIIGSLAAGAVIKTFYNVDKCIKLDEKALKKYASAFEISKEAELAVIKKAEFTDKRLMNVAKKKRAIIEVSIPKFIQVYENIQKIEVENKVLINELEILKDFDKVYKLEVFSLSTKKSFTDKELICGLAMKGLSKMWVMDSERNLSAANNQLSTANVLQAQAESIVSMYDAIIARADRLSNLLMALNALFIKSIHETDCTIRKNGLDIKIYTDYEKGVLMTCVNIAKGLSEIIDVAVVDENGKIFQSGLDLIIKGEKHLNSMRTILNS